MEAEQDSRNQAHAKQPRFQYSLRTLFVVMSLLALGFSLLCASPGWVRLLSGLCCTVMVPAVLTTLLLHSQGYVRTFCVGALFPSAWAMFSLGYIFFQFSGVLLGEADLSDYDDLGKAVAVFVAISTVLSLAVGLLCMAIRWMIEAPRRQQHQTLLPPAEGR